MKASGQMSLRNVMQSPAEDEGGKDQANCIVVKDRPMLSSKGEPLTNLVW